MPPWPSRVSEPMIPGPGPTSTASQSEPVSDGVERAGDAERLMLAAVGGRRGDMAAEQAAFAQNRHVAGERPRQGAAAGLDIADFERPAQRLGGLSAPDGPGLRRRPRGRRQVPVQGQDQDRNRAV